MMDTRLTSTHGIWRRLIAASVVLALVMALGATSVSAVSPTRCRVRNLDTGVLQTSLQEAVDLASPGQRLTVKGTCQGTTVIDKDLSIRGKGPRSHPATLDSNQSDRVMTVTMGVSVVLEALVIRDGLALKGGGVLNRGALTLREVAVRGNRVVASGKSGGGAGVFNSGTLTLYGFSRIIGNTASGYSADGGGVFNSGTLTLDDTSRIERNTVRSGILHGWGTTWVEGHGGGVANFGTLTLNDRSAISDNTVLDDCRTTNVVYGGGGGVQNGGSLVLNGSSRISRNSVKAVHCRASTVLTRGGGVGNGGSLVLNGSSRISRNSVVAIVGGDALLAGRGGGVLNGGSLVLNDSSVIGDNAALEGGGVEDGGETPITMTGLSAISGNTAGEHGGGIRYKRTSELAGVACGPGVGANVRRNRPDDCYLVTWNR